MNKALLKRIRKAKLAENRATWKRFTDDICRLLPVPVVRIKPAYSQAVVLKKYAHLSDEEKSVLQIEFDAYCKDLTENLGIASEAWTQWIEDFDKAIEGWDDSKPSLEFSPRDLPLPPACPQTALDKLAHLSFEVDAYGYVHAQLIIKMAYAVARHRLENGFIK